MTERAGIFDNGMDFDVSGFAPKQPTPPEKKPPVETVRAISEAARFPSREAVAPPTPVAEVKRDQRRYRTGRNVQLNIKVKAETLEAFYKIADREGWVLGETLERAVKALDESLKQAKMKDSGN